MSHRHSFNPTEAAIIGRTLRMVADDLAHFGSSFLINSHRDYLTRLAYRFDPNGDTVTSDEAKMVNWLLDYATAAGAKVQELQIQVNQIQQDQQAAQPTVDRLTKLYNDNQQAAATATDATAPAPATSTPQP